MDEQRASTPTIDERRDPMSQVGATACRQTSIFVRQLVYGGMQVRGHLHQSAVFYNIFLIWLRY